MNTHCKQSQIISLAGFGMTLFIMLATWIFHLSLYFKVFPGDKQSFESFSYNGFVIGGSLLLVGLILCIIGLSLSVKEKRGKTLAIWGMVFAFLTIATFVMDSLMAIEPVNVVTPPAESQTTTEFSDCVVLSLDSSGTLQCVDYRAMDDSIITLNISDKNFNPLFSNWILEKCLKNDSCLINDGRIIVMADANSDFSSVKVVLDALQANNLNKYSVMTSLKE